MPRKLRVPSDGHTNSLHAFTSQRPTTYSVIAEITTRRLDLIFVTQLFLAVLLVFLRYYFTSVAVPIFTVLPYRL
jgi:hypothetical protein